MAVASPAQFLCMLHAAVHILLPPGSHHRQCHQSSLAVQEGLLRRLIRDGHFKAAVTAMSATLQLAGVAVPAASPDAGG